MATTKTQTQIPTKFFYEHAGYSYDPATETQDQGRQRGARILARAERKARQQGYYFVWGYDGRDSSEWIANNTDGGQNRNPWPTWQCLAYDANGHVVASLHGIDFGRDREPWGDPYRRVVEAELALEAGL